MKIIDYHNVSDNFLCASAATVGNFDGVHIGHRAIIGKALFEGKARSVPAVVVTFDPHPREVVQPGQVVPAIVPFAERVRLIAEMGVDYLLKVEFTREFAERTAGEFIGELAARVHPAAMVIGHDFRFGRGREGDHKFLTGMGARLGFTVFSVPAIEFEGEPVSSTRVRNMVAAGQMRRVRKLLGAPFSVTGEVIHGHHRGRDLGFATANLRWHTRLIPAEGVYAAIAYMNGDSHPAVVNIGRNPTFGDEPLALEAHLLDFTGDIYTKNLRIAFLYRQRGEIKFNSPEALVAQIKKDVAEAREIIALEGGREPSPNLPAEVPAEGGPA